MGAKCIVGGDIYTPLETIPRGTIIIENGQIEALGPSDEIILPEHCDVIEAHDQRVLPGLVDLHFHGLAGKDVVDAGAAVIPLELTRFGVTSFQATIPAAPLDQMTQAIANLSRLRATPGARFVGVHLEGPFLSPSQPGALNRRYFRRPSIDELARLVSAGEGMVRMVTLAPELDGALDLISWLKENGVIAAIGHSDASFEDVLQATAAGLSYSTHTFNAMGTFHHRLPGALGAIMVSDSIVAEVIGDGVHVHPAVVSLLLRAKGSKGVCLASDASPLAGLTPGTYGWLGQKVRVDETSHRLADGTLVGSGALLDRQLSTLEKSVNVPYQQLAEMATHTPSRVLGLRSGLLAAGRSADIAVFDSQHRCRLTMVDGDIFYSA